jgi:hypothetical protein
MLLIRVHARRDGLQTQRHRSDEDGQKGALDQGLARSSRMKRVRRFLIIACYSSKKRPQLERWPSRSMRPATNSNLKTLVEPRLEMAKGDAA